MAVIKHAESGRLAKQAIVLDLGDLRRVAEAMEHEAIERATGIVTEARRERERLITGAVEKGHSDGFRAGHAEGMTEGRGVGRAEALAAMTEQLGLLKESWRAALSAFEMQRDGLLLAAESEVLALAVAVAERVTKRVVKLDGAVVKDQLASALALAVRPSRLSVEVNADDLALAQEALPGLVERLARDAHFTLGTSDALSRGSAVVRTDLGEIDASIDTQLDRIIEAILPGHSSAESQRGAAS